MLREQEKDSEIRALQHVGVISQNWRGVSWKRALLNIEIHRAAAVAAQRLLNRQCLVGDKTAID